MLDQAIGGLGLLPRGRGDHQMTNEDGMTPAMPTPSSTKKPAQSRLSSEDDARLKIAFRLLQGASLGLLGVAGIMVAGSTIVAALTGKADPFLNTVDKIFISLMPVVATWVGTVLAFQDLVTYQNAKYGKVVENSFAFVAKGRMLADAVAAMSKQAERAGVTCQDVFVTDTGKTDEPVLGWLTDRRIHNFAQFSEG